MEVRGPRSFWVTAMFLTGTAGLLVGERVAGETEAAAAWVRFGGFGLLGLASGLRVLVWVRWTGGGRRAQVWMTAFQSVGLLALVVKELGRGGFAAATWPATLLVSVVPLILMEMSLSSMTGAGIDVRRVVAAAMSGLELACVVTTVLAVGYVAAKTNVSKDLSFLVATRPSTGTHELAAALTDDVEVRAFFPQPNEIRDRLQDYFSELRHSSKHLDVVFMDLAVDHAAAQKYGVAKDGMVVVARGDRMVPIEVGVELNLAREKLQDFDVDLQWALSKVGRDRVAYFLVGHGERSIGDDELSGGGEIQSPTPTIKVGSEARSPSDRLTVLRRLLERQGYSVRPLTISASGSGSVVPADATVVFVVGPTAPLLPEELEALRSYIIPGGRVALFLDAQSKVDLAALLNPYGLQFVPKPVASTSEYLRKSFGTSDRANLVLRHFPLHPATMTLARGGGAFQLMLSQAGYFDTYPAETSASISVLLQAPGDAWADGDGDFLPDEADEPRRPHWLGIAISKDGTKTEQRLLLYADADVVSDALLDSPGNQQLVVDGMAYLVMDESVRVKLGVSDPVIRHTQRQDAAWFYSLTFGMPLAVLGVGFVARRRGR